jgi:hypothetical protein
LPARLEHAGIAGFFLMRTAGRPRAVVAVKINRPIDCCLNTIAQETPAHASAPPPHLCRQTFGAAAHRFRARYDAVEAHRAALVARLAALGESGRRHPGYKRALKLLNETFRRSKLAQRLAVLQAAAWLIDMLEKLTGVA